MNTITARELDMELMHAGLYHVRPHGYLDLTYQPPLSGWLTGEFYAFFRATLAALNTLTYLAEGGDCDDFAEQYVSWAKTCHRRMRHNTGLPVGVLCYTSSTGGGHAIVAAVTSDKGLVFIEPQTGQLIPLDANEKLSAWHLRV